MKAMVLAAGLGTRLRPHTERTPKPLFPVLGVPVMEWVLRGLRLAGVTDVMVNIHHLPARIVRKIGSGEDLGLRVEYSEEPVVLGTGGGLSAVRRFFDGEDCFFVHNSDAFHDWDLSGLVRRHRESGAAATMALVADPARPEAMLVKTSSGSVTSIADGPGCGGSGMRMFSGVSVLSGVIFDHLPSGEVSCLVRNGIVPMIEAGKDVAGPVMEDVFCDIGTEDRYLSLHGDLLPDVSRLFDSRSIQPPVEARPGVFVTGNPVIDPGAEVQVPVLLCDGARMNSGAQVGPNVVMCKGSRAGPGASVHDAVLFPGVGVNDAATGIVSD